MKISKPTVAQRRYELRRRILQICLALTATIVLNGCSAYRAERLKNKSYKDWKARQSNEESLRSNKDSAQNHSVGKVGYLYSL